MGIAGAVLETLATQIPAPPDKVGVLRLVVAILGAVALALVPAIQMAKLGKDRVRNWIRARSVSESLKTEIYLYLTGTEPYAKEEERDENLRKRRDEVIGKVSDLERYAPPIEVPPETPPPEMDIGTYVEERVKKQIHWYRDLRAAKMAKCLGWFRTAEFALGLVATALGAAAAVLEAIPEWQGADRIGIWVAVVTTIVGAVVAHVAASRYEHLIVSYRATARRLESLCDEWEDKKLEDITKELESAFVRKCEDAISVENQSWMAEWLDKGKAGAS